MARRFLWKFALASLTNFSYWHYMQILLCFYRKYTTVTDENSQLSINLENLRENSANEKVLC